jgi:NodT family efflux transporter outer membrane factor (OMF) lipoprotein
VQNGFKVGPNYRKPDAQVANHWIDADNPDVSSRPAHDSAWWKNLHDPIVDTLIFTAYRQNLTLRVAGLRILEARAQRGIAVGSLFPQEQQVNGSYSRNTISKNYPTNTSGAAVNFDNWAIGAVPPATNLAWELDFWGFYRRAVEAADANLDVSVENYDDVLVLLLSEVAQQYVNVRTAEQRLDYARQNVGIQKQGLNLATVKFTNGATTKLDVTQGESTLAQTQAAIPPLETARRQAANQICILLGMPPRDIDDLLDGHKPIPAVSPQVALGVPAELLRRRPDIRSAEREVAAQCAQIGIATAQLYPHFSISGSISYDAANFKDLFSPGSFGGGVGPSFYWNVLNYGRLVNGIRVQDARFQKLVATYQNKVLQANAEAEDALVSFLNAQHQVKYLATSTKSAEESVGLVRDQYNAGKTDFNRVLIVEQQLTQQQDALAVAQGLVVQSLIQLYKALGGGWQIRLSDADASPATASAESQESASEKAATTTSRPEELPPPESPSPPLPPR